jgi:hypothetical protein
MVFNQDFDEDDGHPERYTTNTSGSVGFIAAMIISICLWYFIFKVIGCI